ncbi:MAG: NAD(P)H-dependent oxidoreductase [Spirochaetaceae bacterium]
MPESIQKLRAAIFVSHPNQESLVTACCREIARRLQDTGAGVEVFDLYEDRFDPTLTLEEVRRRASFDPLVVRYQEAIRNSSLLVFGHPDWWGGAPAILKGFVDRVFQAGVAFTYDGPEFGRQTLRPLLTGKSALVVATTDRPAPPASEPIARFWREGVFAYCGIETATVSLFYGTRDSRLRGRKAWIAEAVVEAERLLEGERK